MTPQKRNTRIDLEHLDDRLVPSAVDLTHRGDSGTTNGGILTQVDARPTGTGYINSFVRLQANGSGSTHEQGYNTTARPLQFDENKSPQFTRALQFGQVPYVQKDGAYYREFLLDINQKASAPNLSLDDVKMFVSDRPDLTGYDPTTGTLPGATKVWEFGAGDWAMMNYRLNSGSGAGDMTLDVPDAAFAAAGAQLGQYVYLYSHFGGQGGQWTANSGFEEWAVSTSGNFGYTPGTSGGSQGGSSGGSQGGSTGPLSSLSGYVYLDSNNNGVKDADEFGIGGVTVHISGMTDAGQSFETFITTDQYGFYKFDNLQAGTYMLFEDQPDGYLQGMNAVGTIAGIPSGTLGDTDQITQIHLGTGQAGIDYDFGELTYTAPPA